MSTKQNDVYLESLDELKQEHSEKMKIMVQILDGLQNQINLLQEQIKLISKM